MGRKAKDLTGQVFKIWKVLHRDNTIQSSNAYWVCENINTGEKKSLPACQLKASIGYKPNNTVNVPSVGTKINHWKVIQHIETPPKGITAVKLQCRCGKKRTVSIYMLQELGIECRTCHMKRVHGTLEYKD